MQRYTVYLYLETALHVSGVTSTHHQERIQLYLEHLLFVTPLLLSAAIVEELELVSPVSAPPAVSKPVWHIPLLCVQWKTPDDEQRNCPKHVEFHSKNKIEKLVHPVGFITRIFNTMHGHMNVKYTILFESAQWQTWRLWEVWNSIRQTKIDKTCS